MKSIIEVLLLKAGDLYDCGHGTKGTEYHTNRDGSLNRGGHREIRNGII